MGSEPSKQEKEGKGCGQRNAGAGNSVGPLLFERLYMYYICSHTHICVHLYVCISSHIHSRSPDIYLCNCS